MRHKSLYDKESVVNGVFAHFRSRGSAENYERVCNIADQISTLLSKRSPSPKRSPVKKKGKKDN